MKYIFTIFTSIFFLNIALAQAPQGIPYQAIARYSSGEIIASTSISVRFAIRDSISNGTIKYRETHNIVTSPQGLFSINIGQGTPILGTFAGINWGINAKFMQVELAVDSSSDYIDLGTQQMMSVPYALFSGNSIINSAPQPHIQVFTVSGTFNTSSHITSSTVFKITVTAGGGGGSSGYKNTGSGSFAGGGGGGAGATSIYIGTGLTPSTSYSVKVGNGGPGVTSLSFYSGTSSNGDTSSFQFGSTIIFSTGGKCSGLSILGGQGGVSYNGTIDISGGFGGNGNTDGLYGFGGIGGASIYGSGGINGPYGSGGSGGSGFGVSAYGNNGKSGIVIVEWNE